MKIKEFIKRTLLYLFKGIPQIKITAEISLLAPNNYLKGRTAIITGGSSGIGYCIARAFLENGAMVVITGRNIEKLEHARVKLETETKTVGNIVVIQLDNTNINSFDRNFAKIQEQLNHKEISILVNNAGLLGGEIATVNEQEYDEILNTNLKGAFFFSKLVGQYMKNNQIKGNILNIVSSSGIRPAASAYTLSKWGLRGFTLGLAKVLAPYGITVNGLAPGPTVTPMLHKSQNDNIYFPKNPLGRYAMPEEIANMAVILTSNLGKTIVGDTIYMTGGAGLLTLDDVPYNF